MSNHEFRDTEEASDARFDVPHTPGDHIGNDHQEATAFWTQEDAPLPRREPARSFTAGSPDPLPAFDTGLQWQMGVDSPHRLVNLASIRWRDLNISNIELRTIHAHLMETVANVRQELRDRGLVVDL